MPSLKRSRRSRWGRRSSRRNRGEARIVRGLGRERAFGFPNSMITKLRYCDNLTLTSTAGVISRYLYAANGIFDPDITGIGHQPLYRDSYAVIYDQYVVLGAKITCVFSNNGVFPQVIGIVGEDDSVMTSVVTTACEQSNSFTTLQSAAGAPPMVLTCTFDPLRDFGVRVKDDGSSATAVAANPSELWCFGVFMASSDLISTSTCQVKVTIEYTVKFTELQTPVQS